MDKIALPSGEQVARLGQGTWYMGESAVDRAAEVHALQLGLDLGMTLIDTAEMYAEGGAEEVVGEALRGRREGAFLVSKVYPHHASRVGVVDACESSLRRLATDRLDLYLLHWRGSHALAETVRGFEQLVGDGKIRYWGVSNLDVVDLEALWTTAGGAACATDQVLYNVTRRGVEWDLLGWCAARNVPVMAYSPIEQGRLPVSSALDAISARHGTDRFAVALAWVLRRPEVIAIVKAAQPEHVEANARAAELELTAEDLAEIDLAFHPPARKVPLAIR